MQTLSPSCCDPLLQLDELDVQALELLVVFLALELGVHVAIVFSPGGRGHWTLVPLLRAGYLAGMARGQAPRARRPRFRGDGACGHRPGRAAEAPIRRLRRDARAARGARARALQPHALLQRQGPAARPNRRRAARLRDVPQQEISEEGPAFRGGGDPDDPRPHAHRRARGPRRHRGGQPHDHAGTLVEGRLLQGGHAGYGRDRRHRSALTEARGARRSGRAGSARARIEQLLLEPDRRSTSGSTRKASRACTSRWYPRRSRTRT